MLQACDVQLIFNKLDAIYSVNDEVSGTVHLTPHRSLNPSGLELELFWRTHGRGDRACGKKVRCDLHLTERQLEPGHIYGVPFRFTASASRSKRRSGWCEAGHEQDDPPAHGIRERAGELFAAYTRRG